MTPSLRGQALLAFCWPAKWVLLDFDGAPPLRSLGERWNDRMLYLQIEATDRMGLDAVLVRPDGVVAWIAGDAFTSPDVAQVEALWLGSSGSNDQGS